MIIGLSGPKGGGKDTIGKGLAEIFHLEVDRFAAKLYDMARAFDPEIHPAMSHAKKDGFLLNDPELGTRRAFLEKLGTEFGRNLINEGLWIKGTMDRVGILPTVLVDVRYPEEAEAIRDRGGVVVHLRPDWVSFGGEHPSDRGLKPKPGDIVAPLTHNQQDDDLQFIADAITAKFANRKW